MRVETARGKFLGELIEVREAGIVVLAGGKLRLLPFKAILAARADQTASRISVSHGNAPRPDVLAHLKLLSRFPHGLSPELMRQLLDSCGQTELADGDPK